MKSTANSARRLDNAGATGYTSNIEVFGHRTIMAPEERAPRFVDHLQTVLEEAQAVDKRAEAADLTRGERRVLRALGRQGCCPMSGIADMICLSLSSVTGLIDRLVEKGLVRRDRSPDDRRIVQVALTDEGRGAHQSAMEGPAAFAKRVLKGLNADEQEALAQLMKKVAERIEAEKKS
jgi:DNA-binding MarR family transcriptional regulator